MFAHPVEGEVFDEARNRDRVVAECEGVTDVLLELLRRDGQLGGVDVRGVREHHIFERVGVVGVVGASGVGRRIRFHPDGSEVDHAERQRGVDRATEILSD